MDGPIPCCFALSFTDVVGNDDCRHCDCLNRTHYLEYPIFFTGCSWSQDGGEQLCDRWFLQVTEEAKGGNNYKVRVWTSQGTEWEAWHETRPKAGDMAGEDGFSLAENTGSCDHSGATPVLTPLYDGHECPQFDTDGCDECLCKEDDHPDLELVISGWVNEDCDECTEMNGTFTLVRTGCAWLFLFDPFDFPCIGSANRCDGEERLNQISRYSLVLSGNANGPDPLKWTLQTGPSTGSGPTVLHGPSWEYELPTAEAPDCAEIDLNDTDFTLASNGTACACNISGVTFTIQPV
jgi:hypothetical protein